MAELPTLQERYDILTKHLNMANRSNVRLRKEVKQLERERNTYLKIATQLKGKRMN